MEKNYSKKPRKIQPNKKVYKTRFLIYLFLISSIPFAIITDMGKSVKIISEPFFMGNKIKNSTPSIKFVINKAQLLLKVLLIAKVFIDLKITEIKDSIEILLINQMYFGVL